MYAIKILKNQLRSKNKKKNTKSSASFTLSAAAFAQTDSRDYRLLGSCRKGVLHANEEILSRLTWVEPGLFHHFELQDRKALTKQKEVQ